MRSEHLAQCITGCLLGGAIGDAIGGPYEGRRGPLAVDDDHRWCLSDDTLLTLATCRAIAGRRAVDPEVIAETFTAWYREGRLKGLGASTRKAVVELAHGAHWALAGRSGEMSAGNGAAMRIAPLAFVLDPSEPSHRELIRDVCRITHHNEEAYVGALAVLGAERRAWMGNDGDLFAYLIDLLPDSLTRDRMIAVGDLSTDLSSIEVAERFGCSGYVVESVPLALHGTRRLPVLGFRAMLHELISAGGDTDTIASMAGQVTGARIGIEGLPIDLTARVPDRTFFLEVVGAFVTAARNA